ncbi:MAG: ribonuclease III, partial [Deltaproteobacteria bacterium]
GPPPTYRLVEESGPDHRPSFTVEAWWGERFLGRGKGASKKEAERSAASDALARLDGYAGEGSDERDGN